MKSFEVKATFKASPKELYDAWLTGELHAEMTGGDATGSAEVGSEFTAWDGYISGTNLELIPNQKIVQNWRTTEFPEEADDSQIEIHFTPVGDETELRLIHSNIPDGQSDYEKGWDDHYFQPMQDYFG